jgi:CARDB protein
MTERDTDLDFDFFDDDPEPPERFDEEGPPREPVQAGGGRPPRRPPMARPPVGLTPLLRLAGLIAFAILIIVLFVFWISSCQGASKKNSYKRYMDRVSVVAKDSEQIGRELNDALTTPGIKFAELNTKLSGLAQQEQQDVAAVRATSPPGPLRLQHQEAVEALEFRVSGLRGLAEAFARASRAPKNVTGNALLLAGQAERLVSGDVVWDDLFKDPAIEELRRQGITGVAVPDSSFVPNPDYASTRFWEAILQRLQGAATTSGTSGGLHGTGLISTKALPGNQELSSSTENTVTATTDLGFAVTVEDTGDSQEVQVKVTLTIQQTPSPIVQTKTIDLINPGEQKTVTFHNLGQVQFATRTTVKVDVQPVPEEKNTSNNSAQYPVIFSLG